MWELCHDCIWFREQPHRCIADGYNKILDIDNLPKTCSKYTENW